MDIDNRVTDLRRSLRRHLNIPCNFPGRGPLLLDGDRVLLAVPRGPLGELRAALDHYLIMEDAEVAAGDFDVTLVHGPRAADVSAAMIGAAALEQLQAGVASAGLDIAPRAYWPL